MPPGGTGHGRGCLFLSLVGVTLGAQRAVASGTSTAEWHCICRRPQGIIPKRRFFFFLIFFFGPMALVDENQLFESELFYTDSIPTSIPSKPAFPLHPWSFSGVHTLTRSSSAPRSEWLVVSATRHGPTCGTPSPTPCRANQGAVPRFQPHDFLRNSPSSPPARITMLASLPHFHPLFAPLPL